MHFASIGLILCVMNLYQAGEIKIEGRMFRVTKRKMLSNSQITKLLTVRKISCVGVCLSRLECKSVNYKAESKECHLNNRTVVSCSPELIKDPDYVFLDIAEGEAGTCVNHINPLGVHCETVTEEHPKCCWKSPDVQNGYFDDVPDSSPIGATLSLLCDPGYIPQGEAVCQDNGTWSSPVCASVSSCSMVKQYQPNSGDGEYRLRLTNFDNYTTRIYCHNMLTSSPQEFLTLPNINYGVYPRVSNTECDESEEPYLRGGCSKEGGEIWFSKIMVTIATMEVSKDDRTFAKIGNNRRKLYYGNAYDCYTPHHSHTLSCGTKGRFTIDLRGTGWKVSDDQQWEEMEWKPFMEEVDRQMNGTLIQLKCGGYGGGCRPAGGKGVHLTPYPLV